MERIFHINAVHVRQLGHVRLLQGLTAARQGDLIWLRGDFETPEPPLPVQRLPILATFRLDEEGRLFPKGKSTPIGRLPALDWQSIQEFLPVEPPVSAYPGRNKARVGLRLAPARDQHEAVALHSSLQLFADWAESAPEVRLARLRFAVSEHGEALIYGNPLPPIPGRSLWQSARMLLPCGFDFEFPGAAPLIDRALQPGREGLILFDVGGIWEWIDLDMFQPARRSAIRQTLAQQNHV
ncbi:MAG: hypothetical protein AAF570_11705 [Bacteroidota bacterium]